VPNLEYRLILHFFCIRPDAGVMDWFPSAVRYPLTKIYEGKRLHSYVGFENIKKKLNELEVERFIAEERIGIADFIQSILLALNSTTKLALLPLMSLFLE
jgi:hypothetical protein